MSEIFGMLLHPSFRIPAVFLISIQDLDWFAFYESTGDSTLIVTAQDDPVIPFEMFQRAELSTTTTLLATPVDSAVGPST